MKRFILLVVTMALMLAACSQANVATSAPTQSRPPSITVIEATATPMGCPPFVFEMALPANPDDPRSYIGHHYDELNMPNGLEFRAAAVIDVQQDVYAWVKVARPDHQMLWLEKNVCSAGLANNSIRTYYDIVDAINLPMEGGNYALADAGCTDAYGQDAHIFMAFGHFDINQMPVPVDKWTMTDLDYVFQLDLAQERFVEVPVTGLTCYRSIGLGGPP